MKYIMIAVFMIAASVINANVISYDPNSGTYTVDEFGGKIFIPNINKKDKANSSEFIRKSESDRSTNFSKTNRFCLKKPS